MACSSSAPSEKPKLDRLYERYGIDAKGDQEAESGLGIPQWYSPSGWTLGTWGTSPHPSEAGRTRKKIAFTYMVPGGVYAAVPPNKVPKSPSPPNATGSSSKAIHPNVANLANPSVFCDPLAAVE